MASNEPPKQFGMNLNSNKDIEGLSSSSKGMTEKVETLINLVEEMHIVGRDNHAIFCEMLANAEKKLNKRIDELRVDMIRLMNARPEDHGANVATVLDRINKYKVEEKATLNQVKSHVAKNSNHHAKPVQYETITLTPIPGFVIKTKKLLGNKEKAFINVFHHPRIELEPAYLGDKPADDKPYLVINDIATTVDKEGVPCLMYNIAVSSEFFRQPNNANPLLLDMTITSPQCVHKIIHKVNMKFNEFLDESNYVLPRLALGYKGDSVPPFTVPVVKLEKRPSTIATIPENAETIYVDGSAKRDHHTPSPHSDEKPPSIPAPTPSPLGVPIHDFVYHDSRLSMDSIGDHDSVISDITHATTDQQAIMNGSAAKRSASITSANGGSSSNLLLKKASKPKMHRKSVFDTSGMGFNGGAIAGRNLLSGTMLEYVREECVDSGTADAIKSESVNNPSILLGWQINIDPSDRSDEKCSGLYVVTDSRKNLMSKSEFRVSRFHEDDQWIKLKRQEGKSGYNFRAMRKVLFGLADDDDTSVMMN